MSNIRRESDSDDTNPTLMTVYSAGVNSAFQAAQTNELFGVELFGVNYSHLESS
jgi:hypothetical protein